MLVNNLTLKPDLQPALPKIPDNAIALHFRRGDYIEKKNLNYHGVCDLNYYYNAIKEVEKKYKKLNIFVFSDDIKWVQDNFITKHPITYLNQDQSLSDHQELYIMSKFKNYIIANSTFSWWGAYLSKQKNKTVIAPQNWFCKKRT